MEMRAGAWRREVEIDWSLRDVGTALEEVEVGL